MVCPIIQGDHKKHTKQQIAYILKNHSISKCRPNILLNDTFREITEINVIFTRNCYKFVIVQYRYCTYELSLSKVSASREQCPYNNVIRCTLWLGVANKLQRLHQWNRACNVANVIYSSLFTTMVEKKQRRKNLTKLNQIQNTLQRANNNI